MNAYTRSPLSCPHPINPQPVARGFEARMVPKHFEAAAQERRRNCESMTAAVGLLSLSASQPASAASKTPSSPASPRRRVDIARMTNIRKATRGDNTLSQASPSSSTTQLKRRVNTWMPYTSPTA